MNWNNFIYLFISALWAFTSCSNEEIIEKIDDGNYTSKLNITLTTASAITKAGDTETLFPATDEEKTIQSCVLGIFERTADGGYTTVSIINPTLSGISGEKGVYNIESDIALTFSKSYKLVVIANGNYELYKHCTTYNELKSIIEGGSKYTFQSSSLLKYGGIEVGVGTPNKLDVNTQLDIELTQLAARIDLKINVNLNKEKKLTNVSYETLKGESLLDMNTLESIGADVSNGLPEGYSNHDFYFQGRKVILKNPSSSSTKVGILKNYTFNRVQTYQSWGISPTKILIKNIRSEVIAVIPDNEVNGQSILKRCDYSLPDEENVSTQYLTFYTYQRLVEENNPNNLRVEIKGSIYQAEIKEKVKLKGDCLAFNLKKKDTLDELLTETIRGEKSQIMINESGQGNGYCILVEDRTNPMQEMPGVDQILSEGGFVGNYEGEFDIIPEKGGPIAFGNYYKVTATITDLKLPVSLVYEVADWNHGNINIPSFN